MKKHLLVFLMSFTGLVPLVCMQIREDHHGEETIYEIPDYLKGIVEALETKNIKFAAFCINNLAKDDINKLYIFNSVEFSHDKEGFKITSRKPINGYSLLHMIVFYGCSALIEPLYKRGADLNIKSSIQTGGIIPFELAQSKEDTLCIAEILRFAPVELRKRSNKLLSHY